VIGRDSLLNFLVALNKDTVALSESPWPMVVQVGHELQLHSGLESSQHPRGCAGDTRGPGPPARTGQCERTALSVLDSCLGAGLGRT
jgi:hypothetical protein